jgi:hypothetical protein
MILKEGGNVFKDTAGNPLTKRINQADVMPTAQWLEQITGLDLTTDRDPRDGKPIKWLGSTGRKADSGDLDMSVDAGEMTKDQLVAVLSQWAKSKGVDPDQVCQENRFSCTLLHCHQWQPKEWFCTNRLYVQQQTCLDTVCIKQRSSQPIQRCPTQHHDELNGQGHGL